MRIATVLFTYNRSILTKKVLYALSKNEILPQKLYIFQDGIKESTNLDEWEKVSQVIKSVNWCDVEIIIHEKNKGLADSIVEGLNYVFQENDAIIVLEDDCVPHKKFMSYMVEALNKYREEYKVHSVSGYTNPVIIPPNGADGYFTRRAESLGWGTWKDRWAEYKTDYRMVHRIKNNPVLKEQYEIWGADLESYVHGNIEGKCNSWAVFWSLLAIEKEKYCLAPYESLIDNIGFDGTGVHSGATPIRQILRDSKNVKDFIFPKEIIFPENYEKIFKLFFTTVSREKKLETYNGLLGRWLSVGDNHLLEVVSRYKNVSIWGTGMVCNLLIQRLQGKVDINYIIKSTVKENEIYNGIPVVEIEDKDLVTDLIIIIPIYDMERIIYEHPDIKKYNYTTVDELIG